MGDEYVNCSHQAVAQTTNNFFFTFSNLGSEWKFLELRHSYFEDPQHYEKYNTFHPTINLKGINDFYKNVFFFQTDVV